MWLNAVENKDPDLIIRLRKVIGKRESGILAYGDHLLGQVGPNAKSSFHWNILIMF